jgi:hypothetical protein
MHKCIQMGQIPYGICPEGYDTSQYSDGWVKYPTEFVLRGMIPRSIQMGQIPYGICLEGYDTSQYSDGSNTLRNLS